MASFLFSSTEWECLVARFTLNNRYLGNMVNSVSSRFTTQLRLKEVHVLTVNPPKKERLKK